MNSEEPGDSSTQNPARDLREVDSITGLPNRRAFLDHLAQELLRAASSGGAAGRVTVIFADLDGFRLVNHERGHDVGDALLFSAARRIDSAARAGDIVARAGADEFLLLSAGIGPERDVVELAGRILAAFDDPFELAGQVFPITVSVGVASAQGGGISADTLVSEAEVALHRAPEGSRRLELYDAALRERIRAQAELGKALAEALRGDELSLAYQPIVELATGRIVAVEALARWRHQTEGQISPELFVGVAEETGSSSELLARVLDHAGSDFARIAAADPTRRVVLAFNVSARQLACDALIDGVRRLIERTGVAAERIVVEISESALSGDAEGYRERVSELRSLGVGIAIDDFGTASTSISQLRALPIDQVKLDRSFVSGLGADSRDAALAAGLLPMTRALGIEVVAEGIETDQQLAHLFALGYQQGQGYRLATPRPAGEVIEMIAGGPLLATGESPRGADESERFRDALAAGDAKQAESIIAAALGEGMSAMTIQTEIIGRALHWIGSESEAGRLGVADEHLAKAICERQLAAVFESVRKRRPATRRFGHRALLAAVEGERHVLGLRVAADLLEGAGFETVFLGADIAPHELGDATTTHRPTAVLLTVTLPDRAAQLDAALAALHEARPETLVVVGGEGVGKAVASAAPGKVSTVASPHEVLDALAGLSATTSDAAGAETQVPGRSG